MYLLTYLQPCKWENASFVACTCYIRIGMCDIRMKTWVKGIPAFASVRGVWRAIRKPSSIAWGLVKLHKTPRALLKAAIPFTHIFILFPTPLTFKNLFANEFPSALIVAFQLFDLCMPRQMYLVLLLVTMVSLARKKQWCSYRCCAILVHQNELPLKSLCCAPGVGLGLSPFWDCLNSLPRISWDLMKLGVNAPHCSTPF